MSHGLESWPVAVFAHNEERNIVDCLDSLYLAAPGKRLEIFVLANGCTDRTKRIVVKYALTHRVVKLIEIPVGDKANAWNIFVHDMAPANDVYFFTDGDVQACPNAFLYLYNSLMCSEDAHAAAAYPVSGRNMKQQRSTMLVEAQLVGNLYALRGSFLKRIRECGVRLPQGFVFEDGLIGALAKWDLNPKGSWDSRRISPSLKAGFRFRSLSPLHMCDWRLYWRRRIRYSTAYFQNRALGPILKAEGMRGMPLTVHELYCKAARNFPPPRTGLNMIFDKLAIRRIRKYLKQARGERFLIHS